MLWASGVFLKPTTGHHHSASATVSDEGPGFRILKSQEGTSADTKTTRPAPPRINHPRPQWTEPLMLSGPEDDEEAPEFNQGQHGMIALNGLVLSLTVRSALIWGLGLLSEDECCMNNPLTHTCTLYSNTHTQAHENKDCLRATCSPSVRIIVMERQTFSVQAFGCFWPWSCLHWCCICIFLCVCVRVCVCLLLSAPPCVCSVVYLCVTVFVVQGCAAMHEHVLVSFPDCLNTSSFGLYLEVLFN